MASLTPSVLQARRRDEVAALLEAECPLTRVRASEKLGFDADLWRSLVAAGALADHGDLVTAALVAEVLGRHLAPVPFAEHVAAGRLLARLDRPVPEGVATLTVARHADGGRLVPAGAVAEHVVTRLDGDLVLVSTPAPGVGPRNVAALPVAERDLRTGAIVLASGAEGRAAHEQAVGDWQVLTAALLVGLADRALELTVAHVKRREQFGRAIGSFQAVQHHLADHATAIEGARLLTWLAAWRGTPDEAAMAFLFAAETARATTASALQYHGGAGYRLDGDIQLFHRRARGWPLVAGDLRPEWERLGGQLFPAAGQSVLDAPAATSAPGPDADADADGGIDFGAPPHTAAFREEVRTFLAAHVTPEVQERVHTTGTVHDWDMHRGLAAKGWIGAPWPVEDGGQGRDSWEMRVLTEEFALADAPTDGLSTATMIANTIRVVGTPEQKARVLPRVLAGEILLCMGYTEPQAGSDVANSQTTAVRDGDDWIVNGEKIYTSMAHESAYVFLLTRTNPDVPKHKGLTMFLVPMDTPGITVEPIWTLGAPGRTNRTVYEDVRVPDSCRVGDVDGGWAVMNVALTFERGGSFAATRALRDAVDWARAAGRLGEPDVRARLARVHVHNEVGSLLGMKSTYLHSIGALPGVEGSMAKLFSASTFQTSTADLLDLVGADGLLSEGEPGAPAGGSLEFQWRKSAVVTIYGGTNEIMRGIIAERHLGLPRTR
jgi:3-oxochol-4-en-24-oyl-CoA dehydrogenase